MTGEIWVITGNGKGKTTSALGAGWIASLLGQNVRMVQFLKGGGYTGEIFAGQKLKDNFLINQFGKEPGNSTQIAQGIAKSKALFGENRNPEAGYAPAALEQAKMWIADEKVDLVILDEISHSINRNLISLEEVLKIMKDKRPELNLILTGRRMPKEIIQIADQVTEAFPQRHPMEKGIKARWGIEY